MWTAVELFDAGRPISGVVFPALVASSAYVVGALRLTYSSAGFYLAGLLLLVPWTVYAILGRCRSRPLFAVRLALAAGFFAACALARSGTLFLLGGFRQLVVFRFQWLIVLVMRPLGLWHPMAAVPTARAAMLFLRSPGGISHHPDETVREDDVAAALAVGQTILEGWK